MEKFKNLTLEEIKNYIIKETGFKDFDFKISLMIHNNDAYELKQDNLLVQKYNESKSRPGFVFFMLEQPIQYISYRQGKQVYLDLTQDWKIQF